MQVLWDVMLCLWVWSSDILKDYSTFIFKCLCMKMKVLRSFEMLVTTHPTSHKIYLQFNQPGNLTASFCKTDIGCISQESSSGYFLAACIKSAFLFSQSELHVQLALALDIIILTVVTSPIQNIKFHSV
jgi:hypothetical protein